MARTVILELNPSGHRLEYVGHLVELDPDGTTVLTAQGAQRKPEWPEHVAVGGAEPSRVVERGRAESLGGLLQRGADGGDGATLVVPDADRLLVSLAFLLLCSPSALRGYARIRLLLLRPPRGFSVGSSGSRPRIARDRLVLLAKILAVAAVRAGGRLRGVKVDVFGLTDSTQIGSLPRWCLARPLPDPAPGRTFPQTTAKARARLGLPSDVLVVAILGAVDERKNPEVLARALDSLDGEVTLLLCGRISPDLLARTEAAAGPRLAVKAMPGFLPEEVLCVAAAAVDVIAVLHDNNDSASGIVTLAIQAGTPVVVTRGGLLAEVVETCAIGAAVELQETAIARAIQSLAVAPPTESAFETARRRLTDRRTFARELAIGDGAAR